MLAFFFNHFLNHELQEWPHFRNMIVLEIGFGSTSLTFIESCFETKNIDVLL
jgi:hypothetical protein